MKKKKNKWMTEEEIVKKWCFGKVTNKFFLKWQIKGKNWRKKMKVIKKEENEEGKIKNENTRKKKIWQ